MSTVVKFRKIRLMIRTAEKGHLGRPHCHARLNKKVEASIDLVTFEVLESRGFSGRDLNRICEQVRLYQTELMAKWKEYHGQI